MLATSLSPNISPATARETGVALYSTSPRIHYEKSASLSASSRSATVEQTSPVARKRPLSYDIDFQKPRRLPSTKSLDRYGYSPRVQPRPKMVDASTQYSPPNQQKAAQTPTSTIAGLQLSEKEDHSPKAALLSSATKRRDGTVPSQTRPEITTAQAQIKRHAVEPATAARTPVNGVVPEEEPSVEQSPVKKARPDAPPVRIMPLQYENCNTRDLVVLIASMLMELIRYNDAIPLKDGQLTRFHSRAPPGISVLDYLQRLTTHATLSPPILLSVVYYIDRLCALYPAFTISSLTVHRFLITSSTVASKGLSDSFWTNKTYARVGGVSMKELALLELEFLTRMEWRIVPKSEVLVDYYKSLIARNSQYQLEGT
ncbi:phosphate system cyclin PHO80 [Cladophialophora carrionii]|uniref:Phosphate system cyclin PHO80 n=1 Tax=Cladophialophora carrionii TaxID=86049 RepID=A0A1C1CAN9_9EURO|nr:phosphate system cyclin PHO80 [Cladophialophora carrionii]